MAIVIAYLMSLMSLSAQQATDYFKSQDAATQKQILTDAQSKVEPIDYVMMGDI